jgi:hypothetical protein
MYDGIDMYIGRGNNKCFQSLTRKLCGETVILRQEEAGRIILKWVLQKLVVRWREIAKDRVQRWISTLLKRQRYRR